MARYAEVLKDLDDVNGQERIPNQVLPKPEGAERLGWLYCAEGSNIGAAFLYKDAQNNLGLSGKHGARHLAPHAEGRAKHWKDFCEQFNSIEVSPEQRKKALKGALDAFSFYKAMAREIFGATLQA